MRNKTRYITQGAAIAVLYVILTYISMAFGLDKGPIQCRLSESLAVLPVIYPAAVPGLFVGCILSNLLTGCLIWDIIFGSLTTLVAAMLTRILKKSPYLAAIPPIVLNTVIIPFIITYAYGSAMAYPIIALSLFIGELISSGVLGVIVIKICKKIRC